jgi:hypothetical protein
MPSSRPSYVSRTTTSTILSSTSYSSSGYPTTTSTAITTPDLAPPSKDLGRLEPILDAIAETETPRSEENQATLMHPLYAEETRSPRRISIELARGKSVRDRAYLFETQGQASGSSPRALPQAPSRTRSTSPLRVNRKTTSQATTPINVRRVPVPFTAPPANTASPYELNFTTSTGDSRGLRRGQGSTKRMVEQWESQPATPNHPRFPQRPSPMNARVLSREYLDLKPLPVPRANPIPPSSTAYSSPGPGLGRPTYSPARTSYVPSPLQHLQTPVQGNRKRSSTLTPSGSSYSLSPSPSGEKRRKNGGRSPLKEMLNVFGGGIRDLGRKAKGKGKDKDRKSRDSFGGDGRDFSWDGGLDRMGSNGLPGGIVFSDRMGDQEMDGKSVSDITVSSYIVSSSPF